MPPTELLACWKWAIFQGPLELADSILAHDPSLRLEFNAAKAYGERCRLEALAGAAEPIVGGTDLTAILHAIDDMRTLSGEPGAYADLEAAVRAEFVMRALREVAASTERGMAKAREAFGAAFPRGATADGDAAPTLQTKLAGLIDGGATAPLDDILNE
jgi:hypothetical protein